MKKKISRRDFVLSSAAAGVAAATPAAAFGPSPTMPTMIVPSEVKPLVIASGNGNTVKNGGTKTCVETAFEMMTEGKDVLESLIAGVNLVELDPEDSVGRLRGTPER